MESLTEFTKYGIIGISMACLVLIGFIVKEFMKHMSESSKRHQANYQKLDESIKANTKATLNSASATKELYQWLKEKNGKLWRKDEKK